MKLYLDGRWLSRPHHGVATYLLGLIEALANATSDSSADWLEVYVGVEYEAAIPPELCDANVRFLVTGRQNILWRLLGLPIFLKKHQIDVAHFQYFCPLLKLGMKYITTVHDVLFLSHPELFPASYRAFRLPLFWLAARLSDILLTISDASREDIRKYLHYNGPIEIMRLGIEAKLRSQKVGENPDSRLSPNKYLLTVGRVETRKNYPRLARAYAAAGLREHGIHLVIVGWCESFERTEAERFSSIPGVIWLQRVDDGQLNWLYQNASGFIFPSLCEGFGLPLAEALFAGLPCAASNTYPLSDVLAVCNIAFDPYQEGEMVAALHALAARPPQHADVGTTLSEYDWDRSIQQYIGLLRVVGPRVAGRLL